MPSEVTSENNTNLHFLNPTFDNNKAFETMKFGNSDMQMSSADNRSSGIVSYMMRSPPPNIQGSPQIFIYEG